MGSNVFGIPIGDEQVEEIFPNLTTITARDRALVAIRLRNAQEKATNVSIFVHNLKRAYGNGTSTLGMVYNATGNDLTFVLKHTWEGDVWRSPYPNQVQNGQWFGFLHVRWRLRGPSKEAIVYRGTNNDGVTRDYMLAWNTSLKNRQNRVYTEIRQRDGFRTVNWNTISDAMDRQYLNHSRTTLGCHSNVALGAGSSPEFVGTMTLDGLDANAMAMASDVSVISQSLDSKYDDAVEGEDDDDDDDDADNATPAPADPAPTPTPAE